MSMARILIVEDEIDLVNVYKTIFTVEGYVVDTASNGIEALEKLKTVQPDIILMDIMMPKLNGMEALLKIKADPTMKDIMVVMLTNLSGTSDKQQALQAGAVDYLIKSEFTPTELVQKVNTLLASRKVVGGTPQSV